MKLDIKGKFENCVYNLDKSITLSFRVKNIDNTQVDNLCESFNKMSQDGKNDLKISICEEKQARSLNANNYSWALQDKISKKLGVGIDEIHDKMVLEYGVIETYSIRKDAFESAKRIFEYYKVLGESETNGTTFVHIRAGVGTHNYNTDEMSKFINGVVLEAKELGIETRTPNEIAEMVSLWGSK